MAIFSYTVNHKYENTTTVTLSDVFKEDVSKADNLIKAVVLVGPEDDGKRMGVCGYVICVTLEL